MQCRFVILFTRKKKQSISCRALSVWSVNVLLSVTVFSGCSGPPTPQICTHKMNGVPPLSLREWVDVSGPAMGGHPVQGQALATLDPELE